MKRIKSTAAIQNMDSKFYYATLNNDDSTPIKLMRKNVEYICGKVEAGQELPVIGQPNLYIEGQNWWCPDFARIMEGRKGITENQHVEFKSSLTKTSFVCAPKEEARSQMFELTKSIVGGWNSGDFLDIYIGINDKTKAITGLDEELELKKINKEEYIARFRNYLKQVCYGGFFVIPTMIFKVKEGKTILHIHVPENTRHEITLLKGTQLWVRLGASTHQLKDAAMVQFISDRANRKSN